MFNCLILNILLLTITEINMAPLVTVKDNGVKNFQDYDNRSPGNRNEMLYEYPVQSEDTPVAQDKIPDDSPYSYQSSESDEQTENNVLRPMNEDVVKQEPPESPNSMGKAEEMDKNDKLRNPWEDDDSINADISSRLDSVDNILRN
ncbi:unnamed protein product [Heterobilharzia americana]|nr:unnamed protein product [Heterobilharzia americana]